MESIALKASLRKETGKKASKAVRKESGIPCVLYGGKNNINFFVTEADVRGLLFSPHTHIVNLDIDGKKHDAIIKDMAFHPVTDSLLHADFYEISDKKPVSVEIPVKLEGTSIGVREGGKLNLDRRKLRVKGLPQNIPAEVLVDISELGIGKAIRVGDIPTKNYEIVSSKDMPVVSVRTTRAAAAAAEGKE